MKNRRFGDATQIMFRWSQSLEIVPKTKTVCYIQRKWAETMKKASFGDAPQTMYRWSQSLKIVPGTKNSAL
jgi:hypothetical protein